MVLLFLVLAAQTAYVTYWRAGALNASPQNPRVSSAGQKETRGDILAANGTVLAHSVASGDSTYPWRRVYPLGALTAGVVGFSSNYYGNWGLEAQYNSTLIAHRQPAQSWIQLLSPQSAADSITLTLEPKLQQIARTALAGRDGAVVALDPHNGNILAMYSNPTFDPNEITATGYPAEALAWKRYTQPDPHGIEPLNLVATQETFPPGSTFKVVTTAAVTKFAPALLNKFYPVEACTSLPTSNLPLCNDGGQPCGGKIAVMLPASCDPGYANVGLDVGGAAMSAQANQFGFNTTPPLDLPGVVRSYFPAAKTFILDQPQLAYSAIGQENVRATALQNALDAAAIANHGVIMAPHLLSTIQSPEGPTLYQYKPTVWRTPLTRAQAGSIVPLMQNVVKFGTAYGIFNPADDVAAKTGTAQTGNSLHNTDDWMIAFAPASDPVVAVAVVVPYQMISATGAEVAGPVMKCVIEGALALHDGLPATNTPTTCPS